MKTKLLSLVLSLGLILPLIGQLEFRNVEILTNMHCMNCKKKIENELAYTKGVKEVEANLETKIVKVNYNPQQITEADLLKKIQELGYQATLLSKAEESMKNFSQEGKNNEDKKDCCKNKKCSKEKNKSCHDERK